MIVNSFVLSTSDFLNKFASLCEQKLSRVSAQVQRVEIVLALLEAKLDSIGWMAPGGALPVSAPAAGAADPAQAAIASSSAPVAPPMGAAAPAAAASAAPAAPPAAPAAPLLKVKDDSRYGKYFKMLGMGVPKAAVRIKMSSEGVDPDVIDMDPEGPAPAGGAPSQAMVVVEGGGGSDSDKSEGMSDDEGN